MNSRTRPFNSPQTEDITEQSPPARNSDHDVTGECCTSIDELTSNEFDLFGTWSIQATQRIQDAYRQYVARSRYKPPWIRGVKTVGVRPPTSVQDESSKTVKLRPSSSPSFECSASSSSYYHDFENTAATHEIDTDDSSTEFTSSFLSEDTESSSSESANNDEFTFDSNVKHFGTEDDKEGLSHSEANWMLPHNGPVDITCGMVYVCQDGKNKYNRDTTEETRSTDELSDSDEFAQLISNSENENDNVENDDEKTDCDAMGRISETTRRLAYLTAQSACMKMKRDKKCENPCNTSLKTPEISTLTNSGRQKAKIYSLLEVNHLNNCNCMKDDPMDPDPLIALLLDKKGKPAKSVVRLNDYDDLMTRVFKYLYPSAYTSLNFTFTLKPNVVKHVSDLNRFERELTGKTGSAGLADSSDEEGEGGVDRDIINNLKVSEQTRFMAAYNAAEMAARASGCNADEVEKMALSANKDFDVNLSNVQGFPSFYTQQEQLVTVIGYVGVTRPHDGCRGNPQPNCPTCKKNLHGNTTQIGASEQRNLACEYESSDELRFSETD